MFQGVNFREPVLVGATINMNSCYYGISLINIQLPEDCIFLGVLRNSEVILVSTIEIALWCGDYVMAIAFKPALAPTLKVILSKTHHVFWSLPRSRINYRNKSF